MPALRPAVNAIPSISTVSLVSRQSRLKTLSADRPSSNILMFASILSSSYLDVMIPSPVIRAPNVSKEIEPEFFT